MTRRIGLALAVAAAAGLGGLPSPALSQGPGIDEIERLLAEREAEIARLDARLDGLEARADSLARAKRLAEPGSARFEDLSNAILTSSQEITTIARRLRVLYEQVRDLKTELFVAYNEEIPAVRAEIDELTRRGRTTENSREMRRLVGLLEEYVRARQTLAAEIEEAQDDLFLPELVYDPTDGPGELRVKEAIALDAVDKIDERIAALEDQRDKALQRKRDLQEFRRLQDEIDMWGDAQAAQGGSVIEEILAGREAGPGGRAAADIFDDPDRRIRELQVRIVELLERRNEYAAKAELFASRRREFYP